VTSAIASVNWTAAGNDMVDPDGICLHTMVRGGPGETAMTRGEADLIPGLPGMQPRQWQVERRVIEFTGWVRGSGDDELDQQADYWDNRIALGAVLDPTDIIELVITLPGGSQYSINARPLPPIGYAQRVPSYADCSVEFESFDPDWVSMGS
jgi:hypothetical protein